MLGDSGEQKLIQFYAHINMDGVAVGESIKSVPIVPKPFHHFGVQKQDRGKV